MKTNDSGDGGVRRRALRAARVATLGLVMMAPGCYSSHDIPIGVDDAGEADALVAETDAGSDGGVADEGLCDITWDWERYNDCCALNGWDWNRGCAAWGPFVPPADGELA